MRLEAVRELTKLVIVTTILLGSSTQAVGIPKGSVTILQCFSKKEKVRWRAHHLICSESHYIAFDVDEATAELA